MESSGSGAWVKLQLFPPPTVAFVTGRPEVEAVRSTDVYRDGVVLVVMDEGEGGTAPSLSHSSGLRCPQAWTSERGPKERWSLIIDQASWKGWPSKEGLGWCVVCRLPRTHTLSTFTVPGPPWKGRLALSFKWFLWFRGWGGRERSW